MSEQPKRYATLLADQKRYEAFYGISEGLAYYGMHCHDFWEIYINYHGANAMRVNDMTYDMEPDVLMIFPPFCMHGLSDAMNLKNYERAYLSITSQLLRDLGCGCIDLNTRLTEVVRSKNYMFRINHEDGQRCKQLLQQISENSTSADPIPVYENAGRIVSFMSIVLRTVANKETTVIPSANASIMQQVLTYVNDHYTENLMLQDIADRFHISTSFLSHAFSAYTNRSVYDYILYRRITLAQMMLHSNRPIGDIAQECGFSDYSGFLRKFTSLFGMSPKAYRKQLNLEK